MTKATPVRDEHGAVVLAVNIIEDVTDARLAERQQRFLPAASMLALLVAGHRRHARQVAGAAVPELADWCCVDVPDERGRVQRAGARCRRARPRPRSTRCATRCRLDPDDPGRPPTCCATGARGVLIGESTTPRRGPGRRRRGRPPCCGPSARARPWPSR